MESRIPIALVGTPVSSERTTSWQATRDELGVESVHVWPLERSGT